MNAAIDSTNKQLVRKTFTKRYTSLGWWEFQKRSDLELIDSEVEYVDGEKLFRNTFSILVDVSTDKQ